MTDFCKECGQLRQTQEVCPHCQSLVVHKGQSAWSTTYAAVMAGALIVLAAEALFLLWPADHIHTSRTSEAYNAGEADGSSYTFTGRLSVAYEKMLFSSAYSTEKRVARSLCQTDSKDFIAGWSESHDTGFQKAVLADFLKGCAKGYLKQKVAYIDLGK